MAYFRTLDTQCRSDNCKKQATVELFNSRNEPHGKFCKMCGLLKLRQLKQQEEHEFNRKS